MFQNKLTLTHKISAKSSLPENKGLKSVPFYLAINQQLF